MKLLNLLTIFLFIMMLFSCGKDKSSPTAPDNEAPELSAIGNQAVLAGQTINVTLLAIDADGDSLSFSIPINPGFLSITEFSQVGDTATAILVIAPENNVKGTLNATVKVSDNRGGEDNEEFTIEVKQFTMLFLRSNGDYYLSREQTPPPFEGGFTTVRVYFYSNTVNEWKAILGNSIEDITYSFSLWLGANYPQGYFDVALVVSHNGVETELAKTKFTVPSSQYFERFSATVDGQGGGAPGDEIILRISFSGSSSGSIIFGSSEYSDSHIVVPGNITVSTPSFSSILSPQAKANTVTNAYEKESGAYPYSNSVNIK